MFGFGKSTKRLTPPEPDPSTYPMNFVCPKCDHPSKYHNPRYIQQTYDPDTQLMTTNRKGCAVRMPQPDYQDSEGFWRAVPARQCPCDMMPADITAHHNHTKGSCSTS